MTYGGALVMPSSYAMMDEEEMMYLEGGDKLLDTVNYMLKEAYEAIWGYVAVAAFLKAVEAVPAVIAGVKAALVALPWSRIAAASILAGVVVSYGAIVYGLYKKYK